MSVRHWDDDASQLRVPIILDSTLSGTVTLGALVKLDSTGLFHKLIVGFDSAGTERWSFGVGPANLPFWFVDTGVGTHLVNGAAGLEVPIGEWCIVGLSISDINTRRFHVFPLGGAWVHGLSDLVGGVEAPATTGGGWLAFGGDGDTATLKGLMAVGGVWTDAMGDTPFEALGANLSSDDWAANVIAPAGAWNFNQSDRLDPVPDMTGHHEVITGTIDSSSDPLGITGTTIVADDPAGWDFAFTPPPLDVTVHLSGGAANADPSASIGGVLSSVTAGPSLFDDVSAARRTAGSTDYRLVYLRNDEAGDVTASAAVFQQLEAGRQLAVGAATQAAGSTVPAVADRFTAPAGVTFQPTSSVSLGTIPPGEAKGVWLRRVVDAAQPEDATNPCEVDFDVNLA
jgi:hypothetical protein